MRNIATTSIIFLFVTVLASCGSTQGTTSAAMLTANTWELSEINGTAVSASNYSRGLPNVTFTTDNKITGNGGCNGFSGSYNLNDEGGMNISQVMATKMFCEGANEGDFFAALDKVTMTKIDKDKLILMNGVDEVLVFIPKK